MLLDKPAGYSSNKNLISLFIGCSIGLFSALDLRLYFFSFLILGVVFFVLYFVYLQEKEITPVVIRILILAFLLRFVICILLSWVSYIKRGHPFFLGADDYTFNTCAVEILNIWKETGQIPAAYNLPWMYYVDLKYTYWLFYIYYFFGEHQFLPLFINCFFGALTVVFIYFISKRIYNTKVAIWSALFFTFWPSLILWSTQNLKESITIFFIYIVLYCILNMRKKVYDISSIAMMATSFLFIYELRFNLIVPLGLVVFFSLFLMANKHRLLFVVLCAAILLIAINRNWLHLGDVITSRLGITSASLKGGNFFDALTNSRNVRMGVGETPFLENLEVSSLTGFIVTLSLILLYTFFSPFPWQVFKISHIFAVIEMLIWLTLVIFAIKGFLLTIRYKLKDASALIIFFFFMTSVLFFDGNIGTLFRHRALIWPVLLIFTSAGLVYKKGNYV